MEKILKMKTLDELLTKRKAKVNRELEDLINKKFNRELQKNKIKNKECI